MMKKSYITPAMESMEFQPVELLNASGVSGSNGITYGGVDLDGTVTPGSRELEDVLGLPGFIFE
jgi:hypothetical protein